VSGATAIPKRIFRVWLGPKEIKPLWQRWWARFAELHPGWEMLTIRDERMFLRGELKLQKIFDYCSTYCERSDVLRYALLYKLGGVFVDADVFPIKPLDDLMGDPRPFFCWQSRTQKCVETATIGAPAEHPAIRAVMDAFPNHYWQHAEESVHICTGPKFVTQVIAPRTDVRILPSEAFLPVGRCSAEEFEARCLASGGYTCNFAAGTWWAEAKRRRETGKRAKLP